MSALSAGLRAAAARLCASCVNRRLLPRGRNGGSHEIRASTTPSWHEAQPDGAGHMGCVGSTTPA